MLIKTWPKLTAVLLVISLGLAFTGLQCPPQKEGQEEEVTLQWWRVNFDDSKDIEDLAEGFKDIYPNTDITIKTFTYAEYEEALLDAISASTAEENKGPDIISIHDDWLPRWQSRLLAMPESNDVFEHMTIREYEDTFVEVAASELTTENEIYAAPLYVDTLALFYNKDLLDAAGIPKAPENWDEFAAAVKDLTIQEAAEIIQSGAAMGTSTNINRSTDILEMLMLQNGTQMISDDKTQITFDSAKIGDDGEPLNPGLIAATFYTDFANAQKSTYTWNLNQDYSIDAFVAGKTAMMFNYSFRQQTLEEKSANLNYRIVPAPQVAENQAVTYPNYWAMSVSNKTKHPDHAWAFVEYMTGYDVAKAYMETTQRPPARRDLIAEVKDDPVLGMFAEQALSARSWWKPDNRQMEIIFAKMIDDINTGKSSVAEAMAQAQQSAQQLIKEDE